MSYKNICFGIVLIIVGGLWFYFSFSRYKKLRDKTYKPNKEEAKVWPYLNNLEEINDFSMKATHLKGFGGSIITFLIGAFKIFEELKSLL